MYKITKSIIEIDDENEWGWEEWKEECRILWDENNYEINDKYEIDWAKKWANHIYGKNDPNYCKKRIPEIDQVDRTEKK